MKQKGYSKFNTWWFNTFWEYDLKLDKNNTVHGHFGKYNRFVWHIQFQFKRNPMFPDGGTQKHVYSSCHIQTKLIEDFLRLILDCLVCTNI